MDIEGFASHSPPAKLAERHKMGQMAKKSRFLVVTALPAALFASSQTGHGQEVRLALTPEMVINESNSGNPQALVDVQELIGDPPAGEPKNTGKINSKYWRTFPYSAHIDLGMRRNPSTLRIFDTFNLGKLAISAGEPGNWREVSIHRTGPFKKWVTLPLNVTTRCLRLTRVERSCIISEIAIYEYTPAGAGRVDTILGRPCRTRLRKTATMEDTL